ncbi:MAG TPA: carboxypeptidase-like regulatory domain-containing protein [Vicinamibacterales bacterium]|nr:carboxypeptidase-like regulatory domain-containing protein [Vicinamibacterales bacterium]
MKRKYAVWIVCATLSAAVAACGGSPTAPTSPTPPVTVTPPVVAPTVTTVTVTNTGTTGLTFQLGAMARLSDGSTLDVTRTAAWDSSDITRATVSSSGVVTVRGDGEVDVHAVYQGVTGASHFTVSQPKTYALTGIVRGQAPAGGPIAGAQVRILDFENSGDTTSTNASGAFRVAALTTGRHLIEVSKDGYDIWEANITIVDSDLNLPVTLIPTVR